MPLFRDECVVLRTQKLGEADRIITLLTRRHGRVRAVAKGVRRTSSRFGGRLEPFAHADVQLLARGAELAGRTLDIVTQAESLGAHGDAIAADYHRYTAGTAILETAERLTDVEGEPALQEYLLLLGAVRALASAAHDPGLILDSFLLRSLAIAGYAPSFTDCAGCGADGPHRFFSVVGGGMVCADCRPGGAVLPAPATVGLLGALLAGDWAVADVSAGRERREVSGMVAAYLQWHLERGLRSLRYVERR